MSKVLHLHLIAVARASRACWLFHSLFNLATIWLSVRNGNFERYSAFLSARKLLKQSPRLDELAILHLPHVLEFCARSRTRKSYRPRKPDFDKREDAHSLRPESPIEKRSAVQCRRFEAVHTFDAIAGYSKTGWSLSLYELELVSLAK